VPNDNDLTDQINESLAALSHSSASNAKLGDMTEPKKSRRARKQQRKSEVKPPKKSRAKKITKIVIWSLVTIVAAILIFLAVKAFVAGGKIFEGNPLGIFSKERLAEDANGRTNVLIFGTSGYSMEEDAWDGALLTDSIMVLSVDQDAKNAYIISLPRDLYVKHDCDLLGTTAGKLNETYYCAFKDSGDNEDVGAQALAATMQTVLGLDIQYRIHVNWAALEQAVNAVGGVDVTVEGSDPRGIYDYMTGLNYPNGEAHMDGATALSFTRARNSHGGYGLAGGNFDREKNQQKVLVALQKKALSAGVLANPAAVNGLLDALGDNLRTNFPSNRVRTLLDLAQGVEASQIKSLPLLDTDNGINYLKNGSVDGASVVLPTRGLYDYTDIKSYIAKNLSSDPLQREAATVDVLNGSNTAGLAQTKAEELRAADFNVATIGNAPDGTYAAVELYQINTEKPATRAALEKRYAVTAQTTLPAGVTSAADFVLIFGAAGAN
jgi:LCP family protein required for cell wall assembly